jgi:DNA transformation protein and related proteins
MAGSSAFQRIERDVLHLCAAIPAGRVCTYADLGAQIDVPARHVAYIVSRLDSNARTQTPVHRLVGNGGKLPSQPANTEALLAKEGLSIIKGRVANLSALMYIPQATTLSVADQTTKSKLVKVERTTRPSEHTRAKDGSAALSELSGLGPASVQLLVAAGVTTKAQLRKADLYKLYAKIKSAHPRTSINLLYALLGAVDDKDWRTVAKDRRTEVLMRLENMGLL